MEAYHNVAQDIFSSNVKSGSDKLPFIHVVGLSKCKALVDSGSSINLISSNVLHKFHSHSVVRCDIPINSVVGNAVSIKSKVALRFKIENILFEEIFHIIPSDFSPHFQIILGIPFISKFQCSINFKDNVLTSKNFSTPLINLNSSNLMTNVCHNQEIPVFAMTKIVIPPGSQKIVKVKHNMPLNFNSDLIFITPNSFNLNKNYLVSNSVCKKNQNSLYVQIANFSTESVHINKGTKLGVINEIFSSENLYRESVNMLETEEIGQVDHTDLKWSTDFDLSHLDYKLKVKVQKFLDKNRDVFASSVLDLPGCCTVPHSIRLTDNTPVRSRPYRVPYNLRREMDEQLNILLESEILVPSTSDFASPVMLVKKADGSYRLAVDFRKLNKNLIKDTYPIPNINESIDALAGAHYFSSLDLTSGFFQQFIDARDQHKTAITTHKGLFQWTRSPFGLATSPNAFQRLMNVVLGDLRDLSIQIYIDDIAVASKTIEDHFDKLELVFNRLRQHNLKLKPNKCKFFKSDIQFLGFNISEGKISPINKNVEVIKNFKIPSTRKHLRSYLGCLNYYRKFFPDFSKRAKVLTDLTKGKGKFEWNDKAQREFDNFKEELAAIPTLNLPDMSKDFYIYSDASGDALGAVLAQMDDDNFPAPVAFASRKLKEVESRYSASERELLGLVWAINYFKCYVFNRKFTVFTDHAPLTHSLKVKDPTSRIARWLCSLADFHFEAKYIKGKCNSVADFLSRYVDYTSDITMNNNPQLCASITNDENFKENTIENFNYNLQNTAEDNFNAQVNSAVYYNSNFILENNEAHSFVVVDNFQPTINVTDNESSSIQSDILKAQKSDPFCIKIINLLKRTSQIKPQYIKFFVNNDLLMCRDLRKRHRRDDQEKIVLPLTLVTKIFSLAHDSPIACHAGFFKTYERIRQFYYWPGSYAQIKNLVASCSECLAKRAHLPKKQAELQRFPIPNAPMETVHLDIQGPFPMSYHGNKFIVSFVCAFSKWPEAFPVAEISSDTIADCIVEVICRHGCPSVIITDKGQNLLSEAIEKAYKILGMRHITTSSYHPAGNAKIERQHSTVNSALSHLVDHNHLDWDTKLKFALLAIRSAVHVATNEIPAFILTGRDLRLPYSALAQKDKISYCDSPSYCQNLMPAMSKIFKDVKFNLERAAETQESHRKKVAVDKNIELGDRVMLFTPSLKPGLCKKFAKFNSGPFRVTEKVSNVNFKIQLLEDPSKSQVVHVDRLSKCTDRKVFPAWSEIDEYNTEPNLSSDSHQNFRPFDNCIRNPKGLTRRKRRYNSRYFTTTHNVFSRNETAVSREVNPTSSGLIVSRYRRDKNSESVPTVRNMKNKVSVPPSTHSYNLRKRH